MNSTTTVLLSATKHLLKKRLLRVSEDLRLLSKCKRNIYSHYVYRIHCEISEDYIASKGSTTNFQLPKHAGSKLATEQDVLSNFSQRYLVMKSFLPK